jgi:hypothetical protein
MVGELLKTRIVESLTVELAKDAGFNSSILEEKVDAALQEVIEVRRYPANYTDDMKEKDLSKYYSKIRKIVLYDYNIMGAEFQQTHNENGINRTFVNREKLFSGILPIARF